MKGAKYDVGKARWELLPWDEVEDVVKVLMHGSKKYEDFNWQKVTGGNTRYFDAALRHILAWKKAMDGLDDFKDKDSGLDHLAHATCCLLFLMWNMKHLDAPGWLRDPKRRKK